MKLGERLRLAREKAGLTQTELHRKAGVSQQLISNLETGKVNETAYVVQLALACRVRPEWLALESGPMLNDEPFPKEPERPPVTLISEEQQRAIDYAVALHPNQRQEWFQWAENKLKENQAIYEYYRNTLRKK